MEDKKLDLSSSITDWIITRKQLAEECNMPYTTLRGWVQYGFPKAFAISAHGREGMSGYYDIHIISLVKKINQRRNRGESLKKAIRAELEEYDDRLIDSLGASAWWLYVAYSLQETYYSILCANARLSQLIQGEGSLGMYSNIKKRIVYLEKVMQDHEAACLQFAKDNTDASPERCDMLRGSLESIENNTRCVIHVARQRFTSEKTLLLLARLEHILQQEESIQRNLASDNTSVSDGGYFSKKAERLLSWQKEAVTILGPTVMVKNDIP